MRCVPAVYMETNHLLIGDSLSLSAKSRRWRGPLDHPDEPRWRNYSWPTIHFYQTATSVCWRKMNFYMLSTPSQIRSIPNHSWLFKEDFEFLTPVLYTYLVASLFRGFELVVIEVRQLQDSREAINGGIHKCGQFGIVLALSGYPS